MSEESADRTSSSPELPKPAKTPMVQGVELLQNTKPPKGKRDNCGAHKGVEKMRRSVWGRCGGLNLAIRRKAKLDCVEIIIIIKKSPSRLKKKNQNLYIIYIYQ